MTLRRFKLVLTDEEQESQVDVWRFDADTSEERSAIAELPSAIEGHEAEQYGQRRGTFTFRVTHVKADEVQGLWDRMAHVLEKCNIPVEDGGFQET